MTKTAEVFETLEYGPAPESSERAVGWLERHGRRFGHFVDGDWRDPSGDDRFETLNPATGEPIAEIAQGSEADVDAAVRAARAALGGWQDRSGHERARYLYALARKIQKNARELAVLETMDNGKPIRESRDIDVPLVARHFYHHAGWAQLEDELAGYRPVGVAGQIIPWNFPLLMLAWKVAPALATGNTVVLKPAEYTSLTALRFAELCVEVGLPDGVVNIVTGDGRTGERIVRHPDVDKIAFTGSTEVGRVIREATAGSGKALSLELGGKSPFVVFEDADLDSVVEGVVDAIWFNQGQVCCAGSRLLVQESVAERVTEKLKARMERLRMGDPLDKGVDMGAIIAPVQLEKIERLVETGEREGAEMWQPSWSCPREGFFYPPTLFTDVAPAATISQVEIFGPVLSMTTFRDPEEAVELANNTRYGLAASVWSENLNQALHVAPKIKAGTVWVNCTNLFDAASGFGGYRESGFGREGGREGLWEYVEPDFLDELPVGVEPEGEGGVDPEAEGPPPAEAEGAPGIDRTPKMYVGGRQVRPDAEYSLPVLGPDGETVGEVGRGNRKDVRNAVEAAHAAEGWAERSAHGRAQVLYFLAENLGARGEEFAERLAAMTGRDRESTEREVAASLDRIFRYAARADKWDGDVHRTPFRNVTFAMPEPIGVMGVVCPDELPLLGFLSTVLPPVAMGDTVVAVPSERWPLAATDLYQVLETSDVPDGVINVVTGLREELVPTLAAHDDVDGLWYFGSPEGSARVEELSTGNMKRTWVSHGRVRDWYDDRQGAGEEFLRHATQVKNIWVPYGE